MPGPADGTGRPHVTGPSAMRPTERRSSAAPIGRAAVGRGVVTRSSAAGGSAAARRARSDATPEASDGPPPPARGRRIGRGRGPPRPAVSLDRGTRPHARRTRCNSGCSGWAAWAPTSCAARCAAGMSASSGPATRRRSRSWRGRAPSGRPTSTTSSPGSTPPRVAWVMVPAAATEAMIDELAKRMAPGDTIIDGGNCYYHDDIRRAQALAEPRASTTSTSGRAAACSGSSAASA